MPFRSSNPIVKIETHSMHTIDTRNVENLFGLWSVFSKCAETMEDGKRLENLSWRLWNRETFCCAPHHQPRLSPHWPLQAPPSSVPDLSSSVGSANSEDDKSGNVASDCQSNMSLSQADSVSSRKEKHITPIDLQKIVISIKERKHLQPLPPLPHHIMPSNSAPAAPLSVLTHPPQLSSTDVASRSNSLPHMMPDSAASIITSTPRSEISTSCVSDDSEASLSDVPDSHSIIRGFEPGGCASSFRRSPPFYREVSDSSPVWKSSPTKLMPVVTESATSRVNVSKQRAKFMLCSSDEDNESSLENRYMQRSSLSEGLKKGQAESKVYTKNSYVRQAALNMVRGNDDVFESGDEIEEYSESAIEDDEESEDEWEDDESEDRRSSIAPAVAPVDESIFFQRVDSHAHLPSRKSLLTSLMHQEDRAAEVKRQAAVSQQPPKLRRSRGSSPNGPLGAAPQPSHISREVRGTPIAHPRKPTILTTSNILNGYGQLPPPLLSPRTTRRNMLSTELTESLRKHLLWERQQQKTLAPTISSTGPSVAALRRRHTTNDVKSLQQYPGENKPDRLEGVAERPSKNNSWNDCFGSGLQEYHEKGW